VASYLRYLWTVSGLTLLSRVAGLVRDAALAHVIGAGWVMDAYAMAFRLPNLLRQLLGEGALSAAFIPVFTDYLEHGGRKAANRFMSLMIVTLAAALAAVTLAAAGVLLMLRYFTEAGTKWHLIFGLATVLFPFGIMVCLVALLQAALNCRRHFAMPALAPVVLNIFIIGGAVAAGLWLARDPVIQVYVIAGAILLAGIVEIVIQVPAMRRVGLDFRPVWDLRDEGLKRVLYLVGPMALAIGLVQVNVFLDSLIANLLSPGPGEPSTFHLGPWEIPYPMKEGAASVLYYGPLIYQFPLGVFAIALATVVFPVLSQQAVHRDFLGLARTASHGVRLMVFVGIPAGLGIILVCDPLIRLFLEHGRFAQAPDAAARTALVASVFSIGLWAYSANHILLRTFYALEDIRTPLRIALLAAGLNLILNLALVWPLAEVGLALSTVIAAVFKVVVLAWLLTGRCANLQWGAIGASAARTLAAAAAMAVVVWTAVHWAAPMLPLAGRQLYAVQLFGGIAVGGGVFALAAHLLGMSELRDLLVRPAKEAVPDAAAGTAAGPGPAPSRPLDPNRPAR
jgi:putative peptidoglycan lipid II flippase